MKSILVSLFFLSLASCVEVGFKNPQPTKGKKLESIPEEMVKFYTEQDKDSVSNNLNDLNLFELNGGVGIDGALTENTILKHWKGRYFLNQKENDLWRLIMIIPGSDSTFDTYKIDGGNETTLELLKSITKVEEVYSESGELELLILDPSMSEFKKIIKSNAFELVEIF